MKTPEKFSVIHLVDQQKNERCNFCEVPSAFTWRYGVKQRGVALFITLIALLAMSLAAIALIRSVDTNSMISGNLALKQAANLSGGTEIETAILWLRNNDSGVATATDPGALLNTNPAGTGYYSFVDGTDLTDPTAFDWATKASAETKDANENRMRYVIQRLCSLDSTPLDANKCLFAPVASSANGKSSAVFGYSGAGAPPAGGNVAQYRITVRTQGPKNSLSYVQAFVY